MVKRKGVLKHDVHFLHRRDVPASDLCIEHRRVFEHARHISDFGRVPLVKIFTGERVRIFEHLRHGRDRRDIPIADDTVERGKVVVTVR